MFLKVCKNKHQRGMCNWDLMRTAQRNYLAPFRKHVLSLHSDLCVCACMPVCVCVCTHTYTCLCLGKFLQPRSLIFFIFTYYLTVPGLRCDTQDLRYLAYGMFSCGKWSLSWSMWDLVPWPEIEPGPLHWECTVLATGPSGDSPKYIHFSGLLGVFHGSFNGKYLLSINVFK